MEVFDPSAIDFTDREKALAEDVAALVKGIREIKGPDGKLDLTDMLSVPELVPKAVRLFEYISEGDPDDPADDAFVAHRGISLFTAYGRGSGILKKLGPGSKSTT